MPKALFVSFLLFLCIHCEPGNAQEKQDTISNQADSGFVMLKSPWGAVARSAILPGWGQLYNQSYVKIPIILGLSAFLIQGYIAENSQYIDFRDQYANSITDINPAGNYILKYRREIHRDNRDTYAWWFGVMYLVQLADAFVDAHLFDFDVSDEVNAYVYCSAKGMVTLQIRF